MSTIIKIENLSKKYIIGHQKQERYTALRDVMMHKLRGIGQRLRHPLSPNKEVTSLEEFWALKDINLEIKQGDRIGIIGRNGAGKSTLLKILSRITEPTTGRITINGRVASLLEVGTGFHPELTGRENIFLNGAILGMSRADIKKNFDEIVAFAEVEKFLDTPVKRYSSGMYVRLAFAVAAHLEPDILLVDEVLAVGDAAFQKKCLGKMGDVSKEGRTIFFVSHNMGAVESLCNQALLMDYGRVVQSGETHNIVSSYLAKNYQQKENPFSDCLRTGNGKIRVISFHMESPDGKVLQAAKSGAPVVFAFEFENRNCDHEDSVSFSFSVHTDREFGLFHYYSHFSDTYFKNLPLTGSFKCLIPELPLAPGEYLVACRAVMNGNEKTGEEADWPRVFVPITVQGGDFYGAGHVNLSRWAPILVKGNWSMVVGGPRKDI
ncbi:MAG: ABC transporter ATP-binding protein [Desulfobulbaceae bacterium]|nr:ABC transporter ATP-binding protein [Desulfobulbaceae bacterium]